MAGPAQAQQVNESVQLGARLASMANNSADHSHVSSGASAGAGGGEMGMTGKGMGGAVTGQDHVGDFLGKGSLDTITSGASMDSLTAGIADGKGALGGDPFTQAFEEGNMSPFKISRDDGLTMQGEAQRITMEHMTPGKQLNAPANMPGLLPSQQQGQGH